MLRRLVARRRSVYGQDKELKHAIEEMEGESINILTTFVDEWSKRSVTNMAEATRDDDRLLLA